jgi:hypothetical protein
VAWDSTRNPQVTKTRAKTLGFKAAGGICATDGFGRFHLIGRDLMNKIAVGLLVTVRTDGEVYSATTVYTGTSLSALSQVACGYDDSLNFNTFSFQAKQGQIYYIQLAGRYATTGNLNLTISSP